MGAADDGHGGHGHARGWAKVPIAQVRISQTRSSCENWHCPFGRGQLFLLLTSNTHGDSALFWPIMGGMPPVPGSGQYLGWKSCAHRTPPGPVPVRGGRALTGNLDESETSGVAVKIAELARCRNRGGAGRLCERGLLLELFHGWLF